MRKGWLVLLPLLLAACAALSGLKPPQVSLSDVSLGQATLFEQRLKLRLRVANPNERELALNGLVFKMEAADRTFAEGLSNQQVVIPALGEGIVEVEASVQTLELLNLLPRLTGSDGKFEYRLKGEALTRDYGRIPFDRTGRMTLPFKR